MRWSVQCRAPARLRDIDVAVQLIKYTSAVTAVNGGIVFKLLAGRTAVAFRKREASLLAVGLRCYAGGGCAVRLESKLIGGLEFSGNRLDLDQQFRPRQRRYQNKRVSGAMAVKKFISDFNVGRNV